MAQAVHRAKLIREAQERRPHYAGDGGPARGIAIGLALSTIVWLVALVTWLQFTL